MAIVTIADTGTEQAPLDQARARCAQLEGGDILFFPQSPIKLAVSDISFLLGQQQADSSLHKNIAYKPAARNGLGVLSGVDTRTADTAAVERLRGVMGGYSAAVTAFLEQFLSPYQKRWRLDYASFRPQEEEGRNLPVRRRNDLLHTDAFPTRPTRGARILRFFTNIHPERTRDWVVGEPFRSMVGRFVPAEITVRPNSALGSAFKSAGLALGLGAAIPSLKRTPYDDFMMRFHNFLKENPRFQAESEKYPFHFPPGSSWMVYTDTVPHAVLAGQYALEQTLLVEPAAMVAPEHAPLTVLEQIAGAGLL